MTNQPNRDASNVTPFGVLAAELRRIVDAALPKLQSIPDADAARPLAPGKWSPQQIVGHLVDSAANNHQRFVRAQQGQALVFPAYQQEHWVTCQHYDDRPWGDLTGFWHAYNHHLAHVIGRIPEDRREVSCAIGTNEPVTLEFLSHDYLVHLRHHLRQVGVPGTDREKDFTS